ncbi:glutamine--fructose-6-phosphate transaminase (isomerizing) [Natronocalculus amylovorans]|uniref:Glutamine--fructose-6-phosphate aminotransferase [isomerizing] n=1 Tax=Natronocalculus amylovorans TaxID=2917812 RepID=A0AAE3FZN9_9EURY|nr:glutamine--fructose-6-phosphate transaminase (isomerizing) [Natronocalculus amylovorans]MCL9818160.1 glutamine--fructose-6-phosphate transaminase (isomerizing) [Natronocalculus amylovorans]NUE03883.1 glutamine--fructose-6-phosphate transaminase (isomerizing) [Halorubraceae archaeon YAN]
MCGITGCISNADITSTLMNSLSKLEYRGYDSAGIAVATGNGLTVAKQAGETDGLRQSITANEPVGMLGIGHTRWSTHGAPTDENAHPHTDCTGTVAVVHNGIIENYDGIKSELQNNGHEFTSETDTEVVPHLVEQHLKDGVDPLTALQKVTERIDGKYALAMVTTHRDAIYVARNGSPLVIGVDDSARYVASDVPAFLEHTKEVIHLEDGDVAVLEPETHTVFRDGKSVSLEPTTITWSTEAAEKQGYDHYMLKEIHEQPDALASAIKPRLTSENAVVFEELDQSFFANIDRIEFVACGTSYHAALYGCQLLNARGIPAHVHRAGEFSSYPAAIDERTLVVAITQSGETADTIESIHRVNETDARSLAVTNVVGSSIERIADKTVYIHAGPEIGVAATKTFSSQVATLSLLAAYLTPTLGSKTASNSALLSSIAELPTAVDTVLSTADSEYVAQTLVNRPNRFFIGRGVGYPVALEGALKFKEITYEHAEGFAAGQLKHGPLALITPESAVLVVFTGDHDEKTVSNAHEVRSRGATVIGIGPDQADGPRRVCDEYIGVPSLTPELSGVLTNVQLQLIAYHCASALGRSIDRPRNLAKSVTVE